jgi:hypothetical protein
MSILIAPIILCVLGVLVGLCINAAKSFGKPIVDAVMFKRKLRIYSDAEIEKIKEYAELFGVDATAHNVNIQELLDMGRKAEDELGEEVIQEIITKARIVNRYALYEAQHTIENHIISTLIRASQLIVKPLFNIKAYQLGGMYSDEENSIIS